MTTETIDCIEDVQVGDVVTLERGSATVKAPVGKNDTFSGTNLFFLYLEGFGTLYGKDGWVFVSATREVPEWEPGTVGTATISTCETSGSTTRQHGMWFRRNGNDPLMFTTDVGSSWASHMVETFVPDDAEALRDEVERLATLAEGQAVKLQGAETARDVLREEMQAMRADLDASRTQVSDLTGRNSDLEALVQEQKKGIQARDTWIEDQTEDL